MTSSTVGTLTVVPLEGLKYTLTLVEGTQYISIPLSVSMKFSDLVSEIEAAGGEVNYIHWWDANAQGWQTYIPGGAGDRPIHYYEGYSIDCERGATIEIIGDGVTEHTYTLPAAGGNPNYIFIGVPFTGVKASDIYSFLSRWGKVCTLMGGGTCYPDTDFALECGHAYWVSDYNTEDISFTLTGTPCATSAAKLR